MKITPIEIRQKEFEKKLRGYDKEEVQAFLNSLSQEWERLQDENKELRIKLETSQKEVEKLREVESSLFKTLKTAEDTGANMIQQANKTAELHMRETQMKADALLNEAKSKAKAMQEQADYHAQKTVDEMEKELKELYQVAKGLEDHRDQIISDIKTIANESLEKVQKLYKKSKTVDPEKLLKRNIIEKIKPVEDSDEDQDANQSKERSSLQADLKSEKSEKKEHKEKKAEEKNAVSEGSTSFFDEIE